MEIKETATKKKRGRPEVLPTATYSLFNEQERRTVQNQFYAGVTIIELLKQKPGDFFVTEKGKFRRQSIAERIGRLYCAGKLSEDEARELAEMAMRDYTAGATVKDVTARITATVQYLTLYRAWTERTNRGEGESKTKKKKWSAQH